MQIRADHIHAHVSFFITSTTIQYMCPYRIVVDCIQGVVTLFVPWVHYLLWGLCEWSCDPVHIHIQSITLPCSRIRKCNALYMFVDRVTWPLAQTPLRSFISCVCTCITFLSSVILNQITSASIYLHFLMLSHPIDIFIPNNTFWRCLNQWSPSLPPTPSHHIFIN